MLSENGKLQGPLVSSFFSSFLPFFSGSLLPLLFRRRTGTSCVGTLIQHYFPVLCLGKRSILCPKWFSEPGKYFVLVKEQCQCHLLLCQTARNAAAPDITLKTPVLGCSMHPAAMRFLGGRHAARSRESCAELDLRIRSTLYFNGGVDPPVSESDLITRSHRHTIWITAAASTLET